MRRKLASCCKTYEYVGEQLGVEQLSENPLAAPLFEQNVLDELDPRASGWHRELLRRLQKERNAAHVARPLCRLTLGRRPTSRTQRARVDWRDLHRLGQGH